ncbi:molybdenum cofactor biosynthesis protein MoaE, partial [Staphylococcus aureus]
MSASTRSSVQTENCSVGDEYQWLSECDSDGA